MTTKKYRQLCQDINTNIEDLPSPRNTYERAIFRKRIAIEYDIPNDRIFECNELKQYGDPSEEEKQIFYTLDEELRDNRNYQDLSIPFEELAFPRTTEEYMKYYHRLITAPDSETKEYILNDIESFEHSLNLGISFNSLYDKCFDSFDVFLEHKYVALRIAYLKKEGYIS